MEKRDHDTGDTIPSSVLAIGRLSDGDGVYSLHALDQDRIKLIQLFNVLAGPSSFQPHGIFVRR
jgi:hypothetical protein